MESEHPADSPRRPWLLIAVAVAAVVILVNWRLTSSSAAPVAPGPVQVKASEHRDATIAPGDLEVRLEALRTARPANDSVERNPFRFQPKAPPPPPPGAARPGPVDPGPPPPPAGPPPPPPIPLKLIGIIEKQGMKIAALSDCRSTFYGTENQVIDGRYRLIRIGVESMVIEYVDGRGRSTVRVEGCPAR